MSDELMTKEGFSGEFSVFSEGLGANAVAYYVLRMMAEPSWRGPSAGLAGHIWRCGAEGFVFLRFLSGGVAAQPPAISGTPPGSFEGVPRVPLAVVGLTRAISG